MIQPGAPSIKHAGVDRRPAPLVDAARAGAGQRNSKGTVVITGFDLKSPPG